MDSPSHVTGVVLAGGRSRRLGRNKAVESFMGQPLLGRVVSRLSQVCSELVIVVAEQSQAQELPVPVGARLVTDIHPGKGALGGIYSGLSAASHLWAIVVACDMPFLNVRLLEHMLSLRGGHDAVVPLVRGRPEPAHAVYSRTCLAPIRRRLETGRLKAAALLDDVHVAYVPEDEVRRFDPDLLSLMNVNTQADLDRAVALVRDLTPCPLSVDGEGVDRR